jgi:hypothetical protein
MITVIIPGFPGVITFNSLARISFLRTLVVIAEANEMVTIKIVANIPIDHPLGMTQYRKGFVLITIPLALWNKLKTMTSLDKLNLFLCNELEKQEIAAQKQAEAAQKKKEARREKAELQKKRCQEKQDARNALKKQREEKRKARLQKKKKFKKKRPVISKYVLLERDKRLQCRILLERLRILRSKYETYDFLGKRPRTSLSMLIFNLNKALETGQPLQRFISSASKHLQDLNPRRRQ